MKMKCCKALPGLLLMDTPLLKQTPFFAIQKITSTLEKKAWAGATSNKRSSFAPSFCISATMTESNSSITQSTCEELNVSDYVPKNEICEEARTMIAKWEAMTLVQGNQRPSNYLNYMAMSHMSDMSSPPTRYRRKASSKSVDTN